MAVSCLHISAALYLLVAGLALLFRSDDEEAIAIGLAVFCASLAAGVEVIAFGLRQRKNWAWVAGLCVFALYVPSLFLPLGAFGLWGLLDSGSREVFGVGDSRSRAEQNAAADRGNGNWFARTWRHLSCRGC
jgi:hypothetical protein